MNGDELRGLGARDPTPWGDHAIGGGGLRARTVEPDETDPSTSRSTEDMHTLIRALKTDLSCMSVRLERLEALLSA